LRKVGPKTCPDCQLVFLFVYLVISLKLVKQANLNTAWALVDLRSQNDTQSQAKCFIGVKRQSKLDPFKHLPADLGLINFSRNTKAFLRPSKNCSKGNEK
jgi:hypothetical protein